MKKTKFENLIYEAAIHSGLFSKYSFHPETFRAQRVAWKTCQNFDYFSLVFNKIDVLSYKVINFVEKYAKIIKVLKSFLSDALGSKCFGMKQILGKKSTLQNR